MVSYNVFLNCITEHSPKPDPLLDVSCHREHDLSRTPCLKYLHCGSTVNWKAKAVQPPLVMSATRSFREAVATEPRS